MTATGATRFKRQIQMLVAALMLAMLPLWFLSQSALGATEEQVDEDAGGAPYVAGELLVVYEPDARPLTTQSLPKEAQGQAREEIPQLDTQEIEFPDVKQEDTEARREKLLEQKKAELERNPAVQSVSLNYIYKAAAIPNDPLFDRQYALTKIRAPQAWNLTQGANVDIAVVDTGISATHPDLQSKIAAQRSFVGPTQSPSAKDDNGHGTFVSGVAAAVTDNGAGVAGACPGCRLLIAKVLGADSGGNATDVSEGVTWAADNGAEVINLSLGQIGADSPILKRAIDYATGKGIVVVAASGNFGTSEKVYPAAYPNVIAVGATNRNDQRASFSSYGSWLDVVAPGVGIVSTYPRATYARDDGTSFSSPYVAGVAGLLAAQRRTAAEICSRIESTAVDLGPDGKDRFYGNGRIDAAAAVGAGPPPAKDQPPEITATKPAPGSKIKDRRPVIGATVRDRETDLKKSGITLSVDGGERSAFDYEPGTGRLSYRPSGDLSSGRHLVKITARDGQGRTATEKWSFRVKSGGSSGGSGSFLSTNSPGFPFDILPDEYPFTLVR